MSVHAERDEKSIIYVTYPLVTKKEPLCSLTNVTTSIIMLEAEKQTNFKAYVRSFALEISCPKYNLSNPEASESKRGNSS